MTDYVQVGHSVPDSYALNSDHFEIDGTTFQIKKGASIDIVCNNNEVVCNNNEVIFN